MENAECKAQIHGIFSKPEFEAAKHEFVQSWTHPIQDIRNDWNSKIQGAKEIGQEAKETPKQFADAFQRVQKETPKEFADAYQWVQKELKMTPQQSHAQFMHALKIMKTVDEGILKGLVAVVLHKDPDDKCGVDIP